jgi:hypothetical protein
MKAASLTQQQHNLLVVLAFQESLGISHLLNFLVAAAADVAT